MSNLSYFYKLDTQTQMATIKALLESNKVYVEDIDMDFTREQLGIKFDYQKEWNNRRSNLEKQHNKPWEEIDPILRQICYADFHYMVELKVKEEYNRIMGQNE